MELSLTIKFDVSYIDTIFLLDVRSDFDDRSCKCLCLVVFEEISENILVRFSPGVTRTLSAAVPLRAGGSGSVGMFIASDLRAELVCGNSFMTLSFLLNILSSEDVYSVYVCVFCLSLA